MDFTQTITELRNDAGMGQQAVADYLGIARATYAGLEAGRREPNLSELRGLAELYQITVEQLVEGHLDADSEQLSEEAAMTGGVNGKNEHKVSDTGNTGHVNKDAAHGKDKSEQDTTDEVIPRAIPREQVEKFRNVLLYLLDKIGAKPNVGETVLYKLLYFIDFDYYEKYGQALIGAKYIKNHYGPTPVSFKKIIEQMQADKQLDVVSGNYFKYKQRKYMPMVGPNLSGLSAQELQHIDEVIQRLGDKQAKELSDYSHRDTPWLVTGLGEPIDYQLAMYRTTVTSVKQPGDEL